MRLVLPGFWGPGVPVGLDAGWEDGIWRWEEGGGETVGSKFALGKFLAIRNYPTQAQHLGLNGAPSSVHG